MKVPECYVCPITNALMEDPVVTVDGFSYERRAIEQWLRSSDLSPLTGHKLVSTVLIANVNLHKAIDLYKKTHINDTFIPEHLSDVISVFPTGAQPRQVSKEMDTPYAYLDDTPDAMSDHLKGACVAIRDSRTVTRIAEPSTWYGTVVFVARPVKVFGTGNFVILEIMESLTQWGGLVVGFSVVDFRQQESQTRVIDEYSYYLDSQGWLQLPGSSSMLCDWHAGNLKQGDVVIVTLPEDGRFVVSVNGVNKVDVLPETPVPRGPLFPFFACFGACKTVRLVEP